MECFYFLHTELLLIMMIIKEKYSILKMLKVLQNVKSTTRNKQLKENEDTHI